MEKIIPLLILMAVPSVVMATVIKDDMDFYGDVSMVGTQTVGQGVASDTQINFDGNADDYHIGIDDSSDDFVFGYGSTMGTDERITILDSETTILFGDGAAEDAQIGIDGNALDFRFGIDDSADDLEIGVGTTMETTERITITGAGNDTVVTLGDATENDTALIFDGNAQNYHMGLDDTSDDLVIGLGNALGTTSALSIDENQVTTFVGGSIQLSEDVTAANVLTASECGKTMTLNATTEFQTTLPAVSNVSAGCEFKFLVSAAPASGNYTIISGNSLENVITGGVVERETDTGDDGPYQADGDTVKFIDSLAVAGDYIEIISDGSKYYMHGQVNADGALTITQAD